MAARLLLLQTPIRLLSISNSKFQSNTPDLVKGNIKIGVTTPAEVDESPPGSTNSSSLPDDLFRHFWVRCRAHEDALLDSYETFVTKAAFHLNIKHVCTEKPLRIIKRKTMLASRFVKKKYRVQYETRTFNRDILFENLTGSTADTFLEYIQRNIPEGMMMITEKHKLGQLPEQVRDHITSKQ